MLVTFDNFIAGDFLLVYFGDLFVFDGTKVRVSQLTTTGPTRPRVVAFVPPRSGTLILTIGAAPSTWTFDQADVNFDQV